MSFGSTLLHVPVCVVLFVCLETFKTHICTQHACACSCAQHFWARACLIGNTWKSFWGPRSTAIETTRCIGIHNQPRACAPTFCTQHPHAISRTRSRILHVSRSIDPHNKHTKDLSLSVRHGLLESLKMELELLFRNYTIKKLYGSEHVPDSAISRTERTHNQNRPIDRSDSREHCHMSLLQLNKCILSRYKYIWHGEYACFSATDRIWATRIVRSRTRVIVCMCVCVPADPRPRTENICVCMCVRATHSIWSRTPPAAKQ